MPLRSKSDNWGGLALRGRADRGLAVVNFFPAIAERDVAGTDTCGIECGASEGAKFSVNFVTCGVVF
jgi:hypothetical protein